MTAWTSGATGQGVTVGVIDSGFFETSAEFSGRIHPLSTDVTGNGRALTNPDDDHGTNVAVVALGGRNDSGTLGIAFNATLLGLRADRPGSCVDMSNTDESGCRFTDTAIAAGVDRAILAGARVINISLGGSTPTTVLRQAVQRAAAAGIVIVVSAGNDGDGSDPDIDPNQPNPFAQGLQTSASGLVIIAGSVTDQSAISGFSNRAGTFADSYLSALGSRVCCDYVNGVLAVDMRPEGNFVTLISGTSFASPQIAGAAALLAQAFPNLTGQQIVNLLLSTATDVGAAGTDATFGRGILNISRAFAPQGNTSIAGTGVALPLDRAAGVTSGPMGDAARRGGGAAIILDGYDRAYQAQLAQLLAPAGPRPQLAQALSLDQRSSAFSAAGSQIAVSIRPGVGAANVLPLTLNGQDAAQSRALAASIITRLSPSRSIGFAVERGSEGLIASMTGRPGHAFLVADDADSARLIGAYAGFGSAFRQAIAPAAALTLSAETGDIGAVASRARLFDPRGFDRALPYSHLRVTLDGRQQVAGAQLGYALSFGRLDEAATVLGARFAPGLGGGSVSYLADARATIDLGGGWAMAGQWREGWTHARNAGLARDGGAVRTRALAFDISKSGLFSSSDHLALRYAQPLRVRSGALAFALPVDYDYATRSATNALVAVPLAPLGREEIVEAAWLAPLWGGQVRINAYVRQDPGHIADAPDDVGGAVRLFWGF